MKKKSIKSIAMILAVVMMLIPLSACGKDKAVDEKPENSVAYVPEFFELGDDFPGMNGMYFYNEQIYFVNTEYPEYDDSGMEPIDGSPEGTAPPEPVGDDGEEDPVDDNDDSGDDTGDELEPDDNATESDMIYNQEQYLPTITLNKMNIDGTDITEVMEFDTSAAPEGFMGSSDVNIMGIDNNGKVWVVESGWYYPMPDDSGEINYDKSMNSYFLKSFDLEGNLQSEMDLEEFKHPEHGYLDTYNSKVSADGYFVVTRDETEVIVIDDKGDKFLELSIDAGGWIMDVISMSDGSIAVFAYNNGKRSLKLIDFEAKNWGEELAINGNFYETYPGNDQYGFFYLSGINLFGYNMETQESEKILNLVNSDINTSNGNYVIQPLSDGRVVVLSTIHDYSSNEWNPSYELAVLSPVPASELPEKTVLRLAGAWIDYNIIGEVVKFNKSNNEYRIEVEDYSEYNDYNTDDGSGWNLGTTKLTTEIISGKVPDILCISGLPMEQYAKKGVVTDLYKLMDDDPELSRDDVLPGIAKLVEYDGKLIQATSSFSVQAFLGKTDIVGPDISWTMDEFNQALEKMPEGATAFDYMTKTSLLYYIVAYGMDDLVDPDTGKCSFDSPNFVSILELANTYPSDEERDQQYMMVDAMDEEWVPSEVKLKNEEIMIMNSYIYDFRSIRGTLAMTGDDVSFKGFPTGSGTGILANMDDGLAISESCKDKEGAWQFVRMVLTEEYQSQDDGYGWRYGLPTNAKAFDKLVQEAMTPIYALNNDGEEIEVPHLSAYPDGGYTIHSVYDGVFDDTWLEDDMIHVYAATQAEMDKIMSLINSISSVWSYDEGMMEIIKEEAEFYFNGGKTAQEAAEVIQNRVSTYINEQR